MAAKRFFYFEHPLRASSWHVESMRELMDCDEVLSVTLHRDGRLVPAMEPTRVITNLSSIAESINKKCNEFPRVFLTGSTYLYGILFP